MTEHEIALAKALAGCTYPPGISHKRFARNIAFVAQYSPEKEISLRQRHYMELMAWRYRRQMPHPLVPPSKPLDLPPLIKEKKAKQSKTAAVEQQGTLL